MSFDKTKFLDFIFNSGSARRFTQDSPILPDVWIDFASSKPGEAIDLILSPKNTVAPGDVIKALIKSGYRDEAIDVAGDDLFFNQNDVVGKYSFIGLIKNVVPLTVWWDRLPNGLKEIGPFNAAHQLANDLTRPESKSELEQIIPNKYGQFFHFAMLTGLVVICRREKNEKTINGLLNDLLVGLTPEKCLYLLNGIFREIKVDVRAKHSVLFAPKIWMINRNRKAEFSVSYSRKTVKADAAETVFSYDTSNITWAIIDSGIDATHPALNKRTARGGYKKENWPEMTRVKKTYDFTKLRKLFSYRRRGGQSPPEISADQREVFEEVKAGVMKGRDIDWSLVAPFIEILHDNNHYKPPKHSHGTHVAGIIGANWPEADQSRSKNWDKSGWKGLMGICPEINFMDLRVFDERGRGEEFDIMAALQFVRHLNRHRDLLVVHGVNLSLAILHKVSNFACGKTPVCLESERLVGQGIVVVAAAGNKGYHTFKTAKGLVDGYMTTSITDPGNAEEVITVGATHRTSPHAYGVSYFSSRGPTGDGRAKPDLVAPGEKITSTIINESLEELDGTSMAAPHVSAAAAILMARYPELVGHPRRIKDVLCSTATDLNRERYFQGSGMLNIFKALQAI